MALPVLHVREFLLNELRISRSVEQQLLSLEDWFFGSLDSLRVVIVVLLFVFSVTECSTLNLPRGDLTTDFLRLVTHENNLRRIDDVLVDELLLLLIH